MSPERATKGRLAVITAICLAATVVLPAAAASPTPGTSSILRPDRAAWDTTVRSTDRTLTGATRLLVRTRTDGADHLSVATSAPGQDVARTIDALASRTDVVRVSIDHRRYLDADPTDETYYTELWGMDNTGQRLYQGQNGTQGTSNVDIDQRQALAITTGDPNVVVAVIDDGVDFSHPDLAARAWTNPGESGAGKETNGIDDDGNGYIDDVHGWDFCHDDNTVHDFNDDFHGTHVAGTIAASLDGEGVVGVAPSIKIMALKFLGDDPACGFDDQAIAAIAYAKSFGVHIANNSWGGRGTQSSAPELRDAIANSGLLFVSSAGNDGIDNDHDPLPALPASWNLPNILSVAAIDNDGFLADFSNYGHTTVDLAAPGVAVLSSLPADSSHQQGWGWLDGTSMAAPHVSGIAALIASVSPGIAADPSAMKARILGSGKTDTHTTGKTVTGRIADAFFAVDPTPPSVPGPLTTGFALGSTLGSRNVMGRITWPAATDDLSGIGGYGVEVQVDGGAWTALTMTAGSVHSAERLIAYGHTYAFRVRAKDGAGNWGPYSTGPTVQPYHHQENSTLAHYTGTWHTSRSSAWSGGKTRYSRSKNASVTYAFTGRGFAVVVPKGSTRGSANLYVDGAFVATVDLFNASAKARALVATGIWSVSGAHTVKLVVLGTGSHPRFDIDALAILR
jgi:subtilisin family serine protease